MRKSSVRLLVLLLPVVAFATSPTLAINPFIMAPPSLSAQQRATFLTSQNPSLGQGFALNLALLYEEEAASEGVNTDLAFAQMCLETSYLRFGNQVRLGQYNFAGLGAVDGGSASLSFASPREGVRAQIQHLKYYASTLPLANPPVNPRLALVSRGRAPSLWQLAGTWASDPAYGQKLLALLQRMHGHSPTP